MRGWGPSAIILLTLCCSAVPAATLAGKVADADGQAVAEAQVWLYLYERRDRYELVLIATGTSAEDGTFSIEDPEREAPAGKDTWYLYAYREGLALDAVETADAAESVELRLLQPAVTSGRIVGEGGEPLAGASVRVGSCQIGWFETDSFRFIRVPEEISRELAVRTDEAGAFALRVGPEGSRNSLTVSAEGYGELSLSYAAEVSPLRLRPAGSLSGVISCPEEPQAAVDLTISVRADLVRPHVSAYATTTTDAEGRFRFPELPPGAYDLSMREQRGTAYHVRGQDGVEVKSGEERVLELAGERTAMVSGRVLAADTGEGLAEVQVSLHQYETNYHASGETRADGTFEIPCLPGRTTVSVYAPAGYLARDSDDRITVTVHPTGALVGDIMLEPGHTVAILVVDEQGRLVPDAVVRVEQGDYRGDSGKTGDNGMFEAENLEAGSATVRAMKGDAISDAVEIEVGAAAEPIRLVLKPGTAATATVTVLDQDGGPVRDATVTLYEHRDRMSRHLPCEPPDEQGRVVLTRLEPGLEYQFHAEAPGCDPAETDRRLVAPGAAHDFGLITLTRHTGVVAGVVLDEAGRPLAGVSVFNSGDAPQRVEATTDQQGCFRLEGLVEGPVYVFVDSPGHSFAGVPAETGAQDVLARLQPRQPGTMGEPPAPRELPMPPAQAEVLARDLLVDALASTVGATARGRARLLQMLAELDPDAALALSEQGLASRAEVDFAMGKARLARDFDEAIALMNRGGEPLEVTMHLMQTAQELVHSNPELALKCLDEALTGGSPPAQPQYRIMIKTFLGRLFVALGDERGPGLLEEAEEEAWGLDDAEMRDFIRGSIAESMCEQDLEVALALMDSVEDGYEHDRHLLNIARRVVKTDPDRALEIVGRIGGDERDGALARIVPFFPPDQFQRAVEAVRGIGDGLSRARALTSLSTLAPTERVPELIEAAAQAALSGAERGEWRGTGGSPMARIAMVARRLGYQQYDELALRAASLRPGSADEHGGRSANVRNALELAQLLAFTAPELARHAIQSGLGLVGGVEGMEPFAYSGLSAAAAELDLEWAVELLAGMAPDGVGDRYLHRAAAVRCIVSRVVKGEQDRERLLLTRPSDCWLPSDEDR